MNKNQSKPVWCDKFVLNGPKFLRTLYPCPLPCRLAAPFQSVSGTYFLTLEYDHMICSGPEWRSNRKPSPSFLCFCLFFLFLPLTMKRIHVGSRGERSKVGLGYSSQVQPRSAHSQPHCQTHEKDEQSNAGELSQGHLKPRDGKNRMFIAAGHWGLMVICDAASPRQWLRDTGNSPAPPHQGQV